MRRYTYYGDYGFSISMTKEQALDMSHSGDCTADIKYELSKFKRQFAKIDPESIRKELQEYGAWNDDELKDNEENQERILWIFAGNIKDEHYKRWKRV
jgi:hypothetical protein